ncbi:MULTISPECIES: COG1361 S-layer family protein [unclassified Microbacterium]|uniref:COG1361 S-layer family protein n=1 Tax=unclassified Microbacterium TaxID=2609290 RepID=UPI000CFD2B33|nr:MULTISPECIES: DUF11 domain-containing protein [unclassified Microbacterium]PQZ52585.1 hypothetical protein CQ032_17050 [Microbacterium sp. MYb43]PQZ80923.1 hypothetical protein CQ031_06360 [Microbacterium sp. MYb40]PRB20755.1 hypothetical protein CQ040_10480 [Microbacterium sp. MYb54]PRB31816.1 hypothetical protein CQ037_00145 [Microbacterium sp. MYb50]PRB61850.1 hypothetical protein CQ021_17575 [Microbacterium sp. MYb24]
MKKKSLLRGALTAGALAALAVGALVAAPAANAVDINGWTGTGDTRTASADGATATITATDKMQIKSSGDAVNLATVRNGGELGLNIIGLNEGFPCKNGTECVRGTVVVDFGQQVTNPKIKLGNLGGDVYSIGGIVRSSAKYTLKTPGVSLSSVGGNLDVTGSTITSNDLGAKNGTVQVNGTVSKVEFQVTMLSKGAFGGIIPLWTKVPSDLHSIDIDVDKPKPPTKPVLTIDKNDHRDAALIGDQLSYDIVVKNTGNGAASNVVISDDLPAGLTGISAAYTAGTAGQVAINGQHVEGTIASLAPGASATLTVKATVGTSTPVGNVRNNACVATSSSKACDWDDTTVNKPTTPILTIDKDDSLGEVALGQALTYNIIVKNTGDGQAQGVVVSDPLPAGLDFVSGSGPAGTTVTSAGRNVTATLGNLAPGQSVTLKVNAKVNQSAPPGPLTNEACVVGTNASKACDTDTDTVKREFFQYTFNSSPTDPKPGETVTYRMEFANNGNVDSANSEIAYNLAGILDDSSWNPSSVTATSGNATVDGNSIDWKGPLASGQTVVITFTGVWNGNGDGVAFPGVAYYGSAR